MFTRIFSVKSVAVAATALALSLGTAGAQSIGDVGQDSAGNFWTFGYNSQGQRQWMPGRVGNGPSRTITAERYTPTIWTDPDGCEHWVMDDGYEGFMTPHVTPDGKPVCNRRTACPSIPVMNVFAGGHSHKLTAKGRAYLMNYFRQAAASYSAIAIHAHTHVTGTDRKNMILTTQQAQVVAAVAGQAGARVIKAEGHGGRKPVASAYSKDAAWDNKRIDVYCFR